MGPTPLALYIFSRDDLTTTATKQGINAGGIVVNDVIMHCAVEGLPFGGVGMSGLGNYHGQYSFKTFTRELPILSRWPGTEIFNKMRELEVLGEYGKSTITAVLDLFVCLPLPSDWYLDLKRTLGWWRVVFQYTLVFIMGLYLGGALWNK